MTRTLRWVLPLLLMALAGGIAPAPAQELDEDGLLVAEEMLLEEATGGELQAEEELPAAGEDDAAGELEDDAWLEDLLLDEEPMEGAAPELEEAPDAGVEALAEEALGEEAEMPAVEEPVDEDIVLDEPMAEEMAEPSLEDLLLEEEPAPEDLPSEEPVLDVAAEKGVAEGESVEELAAEALGEAELDEPSGAAPEPPAATTTVDEAALAEDDMLLELLGEETAAEETAAEEPMAEEPPVEEPAIAEEPSLDDMPAEEPAAIEEPSLDDLLAEEPAAEEPAEEAAMEEAAPAEAAPEEPELLEDDLLDQFLAEEPTLEEPMAEEPAAEEPAAEEPAFAEEELLDELLTEEPMAEEPMAEEPMEEEPAAEEPPVAEIPAVEEPVAEAPMAEVEPVAPAPTPAPKIRGLEGSIEMIREAEALKRRAFRAHAEETLRAAAEALQGRRYQQARTLYENAINTLERLGRRPEDKPLRDRANRGLAEALYRRADVLRRQKEMEDALQSATLASQAGHPDAPDLVHRIKEETEAPPPPAPVTPPPRWRQQEYLEAEADIAEQLKAGRQYYMSEEYDRAQAMFESILAKDPYNTEAIRMLEKTGQAKHDVAAMEIEATRRNMMAQLRATWNPRDYDVEQIEIPLGPEDGAPRLDIGQAERQAIRDKMENITIPQIEFRQANIQDVIAFLQESSRDFDRDAAEGERRGVNIILNLQRADQAAPAPAAPLDPFAEQPAGGDTTAGGIPLITFSARQISLLEALKIVTDVSGLKYRIDRNVVMVLPLDAPEGRIVTRMYDVLPTVEERIGQVGRALTSARGGGIGAGGATLGGGGFTFAEDPGVGDGVDWKAAFNEMGVSWPSGSSIKYVRAMGKLVVANTEENLVDFEEILAELNVLPSQIEIEARFVEVSQTDLDSLGFEWLLTDNWEIAQRRGQAGTALSGRQRIVMPANAASGGFTAGNRFLRDMSGGAGESSITDDLLTVASVLTNPEVTMVLHALQQSGNTDLLSAPKVVTQSGSEATIKVVTEYVYPTDYDVRTESTGGGRDETGRGGGVRGFVEPSGFETREVGVILTVLPEVSPEGQMINLTMNPEVVSEPIWRDYGTVYTDENGNEQQLRMEQPFFFTRSIATTISIYNGATVVMGGMITETRNTVDDRIPLLGSIPVLGRLFRSSYDSSEKRNLLIFVTARLVDPAGRPLKRSERDDIRAAAEPAP